MEMQKILVQFFFERKSNLLMNGWKIRIIALDGCGENLMECEEDQIFQAKVFLSGTSMEGALKQLHCLNLPSGFIFSFPRSASSFQHDIENFGQKVPLV